MFGLQPWHLIVILAVALIIFGPSRLPEIGRAVGKSIAEFRDAATSAQDALQKGMDEKPKSEPEPKSDVQPKS